MIYIVYFIGGLSFAYVVANLVKLSIDFYRAEKERRTRLLMKIVDQESRISTVWARVLDMEREIIEFRKQSGK